MISDSALARRPGLGCLDLLRAGLGLNPVERVERRDERELEAVLDGVTGEPRQPVIGVDGVGWVVARPRLRTSRSRSSARSPIR